MQCCQERTRQHRPPPFEQYPAQSVWAVLENLSEVRVPRAEAVSEVVSELSSYHISATPFKSNPRSILPSFF